MEKRLILTVVLCALVWFGFDHFFGVPNPKQAPPKEQVSTQNQKPVVAQPEIKVPGSSGSFTRDSVVVVRKGVYQATLTNEGAAMTSLLLLDKRYLYKDEPTLTAGSKVIRQGLQPMELIPTYKPSLGVDFSSKDKGLPSLKGAQWNLISTKNCNTLTTPVESRPGVNVSKAFSIDKGQTCELVYEFKDAVVSVKKTLTFSGDSSPAYAIPMTLEVTNLSAQRIEPHVVIALSSYQDPTQKNGFLSRTVPENHVTWYVNDKMRTIKYEELNEKGMGDDLDKIRGMIGWIGVGQQYFLQAVALSKSGDVGDKMVFANATKEGAIDVSAEYRAFGIEPKQAKSYQTVFYAGPKLPEILREVQLEGNSVELQTSIDYTLEKLVKPLLWCMRQIQTLVKQWGLAIIIMTFLLKLLTLYPSYRSSKSMKAMADLKPELDALQKKYGDDKQRLNQEMMNLYKKRGVSPLGGCLPLLLQMPIYFAFYSMLQNAVEFYQMKFLWIPDLTAADPYFILPLFTGAMMFLQTRLTPSTSSDPQQKMMATVMPLMFTVLTIFSPAGVSLYILTNTILGITQQFIMNRYQKKAVNK